MFYDNVVVNNVYRKINEIENLDANKNKEINLFYLAEIAVGCLILFAACLIFELTPITTLFFVTFLLAIGISIGIALEIKKVRVYTKKQFLALEEVKAELCDYLSKPHVQKELIKFFQLTFGNKTIDELKKLFALKEHVAAYLYIDKIIKSFLEIEKQKDEQIRSEELLQNYEQKLKKTSRAKLHLVQ